MNRGRGPETETSVLLQITSKFATTLWASVIDLANLRSVSHSFRTNGESGSSSKHGADQILSQQIEENRIAKVPGYCAISAVGWMFFGLFYVVRSTPYSAILCLSVSAALFGMYIWIVRNPAQRKQHANLHLGITFIGLIFEVLTSGVSTSNTLPFFCCLGVMAAHQSGAGIALLWTALSAGMVAAFHFVFDAELWPDFRGYDLFNSAVAFGGLFLLLTAMAAQAEWFATKYFVLLLNKANELSQIAQHDQLTKLANRYRFRTELEQARESYLETGKSVGLLMLDLDSFKNVNDTLGHLAGDTVLREVAARLTTVIDDQYTISRIGGDEFTVIVRSASIEKLDSIAQQIIAAFDEPIHVTDHELTMALSVGAALLPTHTKCINELQAFADLAVYAAKESVHSIAHYAPQMTESVIRKRTLVERLSRAIEAEEFELVYQPQVSTTTNQIIGVEALLRWTPCNASKIRPSSGLADNESVSPAEFVPILESTGQIVGVGRWVLEQSCQQARVWLDMGVRCCVSVNVSPVQFQSADFVDDVQNAIHQSGIPAHCLDLEITEGVMVDRLEETRHKLQCLKDSGVKVSVDDFGTGYSSLSYLKHLSLDRLKIDRAFVKDIPDRDDGSIAAAIVGLAHSLDLTVVAEGVETEEQLRFLSQLDCEAYQGYLFSKPLPVMACTALLLKELQTTESATAVLPTA